MLKSFYPDAFCKSAYAIDYAALYRSGVRGLIFDIDNTLVPPNAPADARSKKLFADLKDLGFECVMPQGAFYLLMKTPMEEADFVGLAKKFHILLVGTTSFGAPGYVRIAYCTSYEKIAASMPAFEALAKECKLG